MPVRKLTYAHYDPTNLFRVFKIRDNIIDSCLSYEYAIFNVFSMYLL